MLCLWSSFFLKYPEQNILEYLCINLKDLNGYVSRENNIYILDDVYFSDLDIKINTCSEIVLA